MCFFSVLAFGQGSVSTGVPVVINGVGQPQPQALVAICTAYSATAPCASLATTYTDITVAHACTGTAQPLNNQSNPSAGSGCSNPGFTDGLGNVAAFASPGTYWCQYYGNNITTAVVPCIFPATGTGVAAGSKGQIQIYSSAGSFGNATSPIYASQFPGADCGAKINAAETALSTTAGVIEVDSACGSTLATAVVISNANHVVHFQGGLWTISNTLTASGNHSGFMGTGCTEHDGNNSHQPVCAVSFIEAAGANVDAVHLSGNENFFRDITLDGNWNNNSAGNGIVCTGFACQLINVPINTFAGYGVGIVSTGTSNQAGNAYLLNVTSFRNQGAGLYCSLSQTMQIVSSQFEFNAPNAILSGCNGPRIDADFGGGNIAAGDSTNTAGLKVTGFSNSILVNGSGGICHPCTFGNNVGTDFYINGYDSVNAGASVDDWDINAYLAGLGASATANTYYGIQLVDTHAKINAIVANQGSSRSYHYGIYTSLVNRSNIANVFGTVMLNLGSVGTAATSILSTDVISCMANMNQAPINNCLVQNLMLGNNSALNAIESGGTTITPILVHDASNNTTVKSSNADVILQPGGVNVLDVKTTGVYIPAGTHYGSQGANGDVAGTCTLGTNCAITFTNAYASAPSCVANDTTAANAVKSSPSTSGVTFTGTGTDVLTYICIGKPN